MQNLKLKNSGMKFYPFLLIISSKKTGLIILVLE